MPCPKEALPSVTAAVSLTSRACGVLVVQEPDELQLHGCPGPRVRCAFSICAAGAERKHVTVERFLAQLGFADTVQMITTGAEITVGITLAKMQAKCSKHRGWQDGSIPAGILAGWLDGVR